MSDEFKAPVNYHGEKICKYVDDLKARRDIAEVNYNLEFIKTAQLQARIKEFKEIVKAVAHIGIDFGYGKFELNQEHIDKARELYEKGDVE